MVQASDQPMEREGVTRLASDSPRRKEASDSLAPSAPWSQLLESVLACPECGSRSVSVGEVPSCAACGWMGARLDGVVDFVTEGKLNAAHRSEMLAQRNAVDSYYENERRLCCHWDRLSADQLPERLDWPSGIVLDLGCGTGTAGGGLRRAGARVVGADLSAACLTVAQRRLDAVVRADAAKLPFADGIFDALVARGALHHLVEPEAALTEASRVLKPGAPAIFLDPREFAWLEPIKDAIRHGDSSFTEEHRAYGVNEYRDLISRYFEVDQSYAEHPFGVLLAAGLDVVSLPKWVPSRLLAKGLLGLDGVLNRSPLRRAGHLLVVRGRRR